MNARVSPRRLKTGVLLCCLSLQGCVSGGAAVAEVDVQPHVIDVVATDSQPETTLDADAAGPVWDDHAVAYFASREDFFAFNDLGQQVVQAKFILTHFSRDEPGATHYMDPNFYHLHDEWYWYRLLNGYPIDGLDIEPVHELTFDTIEEIYEAYQNTPTEELPLDLRFAGDRLYSPYFYKQALWIEERFFGVGSILYYPPEQKRVIPEELWVFELEFVDDDLDEAKVSRFFERLMAILPDDVAPELRWLARSEVQETLAQTMKEAGGPFAERSITYADLVVDSAVEIYNPGIVAGLVRLVAKGTQGAGSFGPSDVVVMESVPDYLPPVAGIVTAVPQTPLAHLNLLAKSRGTPNAYVAGVFDDEGIADWAYWKKPVALNVSEGSVQWLPLSQEEYETYLSHVGTPTWTLEPISLSDMPYTVDLSQKGLADMPELIPMIGGKAAGMGAFNDFPVIEIPATPMAISIRPYAEHLGSFQTILTTMLGHSVFEDSREARFVVLEGSDDFEQEHAGDEEAMEWLDGFLQQQHSETFLGSIVKAGGLKRMVRDQTVDEQTHELLRQALESQFSSLAPSQGLRFRSSSTVEDIEGFNGAGLYDSNTGYLFPETIDDADLAHRTFDWALKKTWASYWGFEAFEERRVAGIDHLSGHMGVLVHPRFDDDKEQANGVITLYLAREENGRRLKMVVNAQHGATSVTNPDPDHPTQPEIVQVDKGIDTAIQIDRIQSSSLSDLVLADETLIWLLESLEGLAVVWLEQSNAAMSAPQQKSTLVLDFEFKQMAAGWPRRRDEQSDATRIVLKQVRTLDHPVLLPEEAKDEPIPRDILEEALNLSVRKCNQEGSEPFWLVLTEVYTDPAQDWAHPYEEQPFIARWTMVLSEPITEFGLDAGHTLSFLHTDVADTSYTLWDESGWGVAITLTDAAAQNAGFQILRLSETDGWTLQAGDIVISGDTVQCVTEGLFMSASQYLDTLFED